MEFRAVIPVFLDFEGVLRPSFTAGGLSQARYLVAPLRHAESLGLDPWVVISSTHRLEHHTDALAGILESHARGLGRFVRASTPYAGRMGLSLEQTEEYVRAPRLFEARAWMESSKAVFPAWIAIDDTERIYRAEDAFPLPELLLCDGNHGFTPDDASTLSKRFDRIAALLDKRPSP